ncbi:MAG: GGDEF domain-containing protein [Candidatus Moranbacteria bacterium]|nr:GGDEF domain-containing protein [Candidatus Moranbacteria bacterium]
MSDAKFYSPEIIRKYDEARRRVEDLRRSDTSYADSVRDLAKSEDKFRKEYRKDGLPEELIGKYADKYTTLNLEKYEAQKSNWIDGLTGLRNKEALYGEMPGLMSLEKRNGHDCSILMVDLDHFKEINDVHGHLAGDQALKIVADIIRGSVRKSDLVYRFGGEEFLVALCNTDSRTSWEIAEKIRESIEKVSIIVLDEDGNQQALKKTMSIGCAGTDQLGMWKHTTDDNVKDALEELIQKADSSLYKAKNTGRNQVVVFDPGNENE